MLSDTWTPFGLIRHDWQDSIVCPTFISHHKLTDKTKTWSYFFWEISTSGLKTTVDGYTEKQ